MKDPDFFKQDNGDATPLSFRDIGAKFNEQSLYIAPLNISARGSSKNQLERALVPTLHSSIVPQGGTGRRARLVDAQRLR